MSSSTSLAALRTGALLFAVSAGLFASDPLAPASQSRDSERDERLAALARDPDTVSKGRSAYSAYCQACHGEESAAIDSPSNLFDGRWYHGGDPSAIEATVRQGIMEKGMPSWGPMLPDEEIEALLAYLLSFPQNNLSKE